MFGRKVSQPSLKAGIWQRIPFLSGMLRLAVLFLLIEFFDELHYGVQIYPVLRSAASGPQLELHPGRRVIKLAGHHQRADRAGLLTLLGDTRYRKRLVIGGGLAICLALLLLAGAQNFSMALLALVIAFPASGAFVTLSQATLMDQNPGA